jgi:citrate lyase subunit beta/citryl-CoA lyase
MRLRSLLFVPGDRPDRFAKAVASGADAIILDLEDSVVADRKAYGRAAIADWLASHPGSPALVRVNPLDSGMIQDDLDAVVAHRPAALVLPKAEGAASVRALLDLVPAGLSLPVLPIATETPRAIFQLGSFGEVADHLLGLTWGAEDLPAAIGAMTSREPDGRYTAPIEMARSLTLFAAHAARAAAIETVFPAIADGAGLAAYVARGRRDGFTGMLAIHPAQVPVINAGFTPSAQELAHAQAIVDAFAAQPDVGALRLDGRMIDAPHLAQARRILALAG